MKSREQTLKDLMGMSRPLSDIERELSLLSWDSERELVTLQPSHLTHALDLYLNNLIDEAQLERWASLIECREDIRMDENCIQIIHEIANPALFGKMTGNFAKTLLKRSQG